MLWTSKSGLSGSYIRRRVCNAATRSLDSTRLCPMSSPTQESQVFLIIHCNKDTRHKEAHMKNTALLATLTCPNPRCQHQQQVMMPTTFCQLAYICEACGMTHVHKSDDCCVYCSYADKPCPSRQEEEKSVSCSSDFSGEDTSALS
ncbi:GDCCVxC domain-containing (seleno)protein [Ktedonosporobacter rubrisoli]|uniref:GDCCVxC domain-containing (seleno)protein n=1 Tax=Ktedonosporobacter rubrisoli TaxID=2509675 RepID=UPI003BF4F5E0